MVKSEVDKVLFSSPDEVTQELRKVGYIASPEISTSVFLADRLSKPILIEGPAGVGKTELAKAVSTARNLRLIRLQCYEGMDESKALYEWNYRKQLLRIQAQRVIEDSSDHNSDAWHQLEHDIFSNEFLLSRPLLEAISSDEKCTLLIDEVDRLDIEAEALMLEVLSDFQVSIPELGTVKASTIPIVFLTSNNTRDLSEALKRRCLYLFIDYPDPEIEKEIISLKISGLSESLLNSISDFIHSLRTLDLKKKPSISETLDWAQTIVTLEIDELNESVVRSTLPVLLKFKSDLERARKELGF